MRRLVLLGLIALAALLALRHRLARPSAPLPLPAPAPELPPAGAPDLPAAPATEPSALAAEPPPASHFLSVPWTLLDAPEDAGELAIRLALPGGVVLDRVDVQETPTQVFVTVIARPRTAADDDPAEQATVPLSRPLGERELVHAPADEGAPGPEPPH